MRKRRFILAALAVVLLLTASIGSAMAYFTAFTVASGSVGVSFKPVPEIEEDFYSWTKEVVITNNAEADLCFVRVQAFSGGGFIPDYTDEDGNWSIGEGGFWYYGPVLAGGESTTPLMIDISGHPSVEDPETFSVLVVYEYTPAIYDPATGEYSADWSMAVEGGQS